MNILKMRKDLKEFYLADLETCELNDFILVSEGESYFTVRSIATGNYIYIQYDDFSMYTATNHKGNKKSGQGYRYSGKNGYGNTEDIMKGELTFSDLYDVDFFSECKFNSGQEKRIELEFYLYLLVKNPNGNGNIENRIKDSEGKVYYFDTKYEAEEMAKICYPNTENIHIREIQKELK